eukprot:353248-Chlamydomonas_euryale.AAC.7
MLLRWPRRLAAKHGAFHAARRRRTSTSPLPPATRVAPAPSVTATAKRLTGCESCLTQWRARATAQARSQGGLGSFSDHYQGGQLLQQTPAD